MTVARAPPDPTAAAEPAFETPTRWDATEQRLEDEHGLELSAPLAAVYCAQMRPPLGRLGSESSRTDHELCSCLFVCLFPAVGAQQGMCS